MTLALLLWGCSKEPPASETGAADTAGVDTELASDTAGDSGETGADTDGAGETEDTGPREGCEDAYDVRWDNWAQGFFAAYCDSCHSVWSQDRHGAPEGVDFDTEEDVREYRERIEARVLVEQTMPVGGGVHEEDLVLLEMYLDCTL